MQHNNVNKTRTVVYCYIPHIIARFHDLKWRPTDSYPHLPAVDETAAVSLCVYHSTADGSHLLNPETNFSSPIISLISRVPTTAGSWRCLHYPSSCIIYLHSSLGSSKYFEK